MRFEDFIFDLFNGVKKPDGALTCFVYVDGKELLNTTSLFKDVLSDGDVCADRLSLAVDPVVGQAVKERKTVALMAVVSVGDNDEVYRFKYANGCLVSDQTLNPQLLLESKHHKKQCHEQNYDFKIEDAWEFDTHTKEDLKKELASLSTKELRKICNDYKQYFG